MKLLIILLICLLIRPALAVDEFVISGGESPLDSRDQHPVRVLQAALSRTEADFGPYVLIRTSRTYSRRGLIEALQAADPITVAQLPTDVTLEEVLVPIRVPVELGLLSYRVSLIRQEDQPLLDQIRTLDDLRSLSIGSATSWTSTRIFHHHQLPVVESGPYEALFTMLAAGRFDHLPRGIHEITRELATRQNILPGVVIERNLLIHLPLPVYFFVSRKSPLLADRLNRGMAAIYADGTLAQLVKQSFGEELKALNLPARRVITLSNPLLPPSTPVFPTPLLSLY